MTVPSFVHVVTFAVFLPVSLMHGQRTNRSSTAARPSGAPTLAVVNARVWTGDPRRPWADALAADGERIALVGTSAEVKKLVSAVNNAPSQAEALAIVSAERDARADQIRAAVLD